MREYHPFAPFVPDECRFLLLGSFPGRHSLLPDIGKNDWYYSAPGNQFWSILRFLFPDSSLVTREDKKELFNALRIAVSDVILSCDRIARSNLDKSLKNRVYNTDVIERILRENPVKAVFFTGTGVMRDYEKHFRDSGEADHVPLPSPSPAMFRMSLAEKTRVYGRIFSSYGLCSVRDT